MFGKLIPKNENFFVCFDNAAENILRGAKMLKQITAAGVNIDNLVRDMKDIEHAGDRITHDTVMMLNKTFVTPIDREDIYALICSLDDVMDFIDSIADKYSLYKIGAATPEIIELSEVIYKASEETVKAVKRLKNLDMTVQQSCIELNSLENAADRITRAAIADLFEKRKDPFEVIKMKEIYETFENTADKFEDVANIIEGIVLKHA